MVYIGITNLNDMVEFVPVTKYMKCRESKIQIYPVKKDLNEMTANCFLSVLDMNYVIHSGTCVQYIVFGSN